MSLKLLNSEGTTLARVIEAGPLYSQLSSRMDCSWWYNKANRVSLSTGKEPSTAYLLLLGSSFLPPEDPLQEGLPTEPGALSISATCFSPPDDQGGRNSESVTIRGWTITTGDAIDSTSNRNDPNACYLVTFQDVRHLAHMSSVNRGYNVLYGSTSPAGGNYYWHTLNPANLENREPWTWETLLDDLWGRIPILGEFPGLPPGVDLSLTEKPNNYRFFCTNAWDALWQVLSDLRFTIVPKVDGTFLLQEESHSDNLKDLLEKDYKNRFLEASYSSNAGPTYLPEKFLVFFPNRYHRFNPPEPLPIPSEVDILSPHDRYEVTGCWEEEIPTLDILPGHQELVPNASEPIYLSSPTALWGQEPFDEISNPLPSNLSQLHETANQIVAREINTRVGRHPDYYAYSGFFSTSPTSEIKSIVYEQSTAGPRTLIVPFEDPLFSPEKMGGKKDCQCKGDRPHYRRLVLLIDEFNPMHQEVAPGTSGLGTLVRYGEDGGNISPVATDRGVLFHNASGATLGFGLHVADYFHATGTWTVLPGPGQPQIQTKRFELGGLHRRRGFAANNLVGWSLDQLGNRVETLTQIWDLTGAFGGRAGAADPANGRGSFGMVEQISVAVGNIWAITQLQTYPREIIATAKADGPTVTGELVAPGSPTAPNQTYWMTENHTFPLPQVSQGDPRVEITLTTVDGFGIDLENDKNYLALLWDETQTPPVYQAVALAPASVQIFKLPLGSTIPRRVGQVLGQLAVERYRRNGANLVLDGNMTAYNASPVDINANSEDAYLTAVDSVTSSHDLSNLEAYLNQNEMHVAMCNGIPKWHNDAPVTFVKWEMPNFLQVICGADVIITDTNPCPTP